LNKSGKKTHLSSDLIIAEKETKYSEKGYLFLCDMYNKNIHVFNKLFLRNLNKPEFLFSDDTIKNTRYAVRSSS
jgi:hypothetical protein